MGGRSAEFKVTLGQVLYGAVSHVPGVLWLGDRYWQLTNPATISAEYCYTVWLRHLASAAAAGVDAAPTAIAEIGPGRSFGVGIAAMLCGAERYVGLDVVDFVRDEHNRGVFDELVRLLRARTPIPGPDRFPLVRPLLPSYDFPHDILDDARLSAALAPDRVAQLRADLDHIDRGGSGRFAYRVPWQDSVSLNEQAASVDAVISQAVMMYVPDLEGAYRTLARLLRPGGWMSHQVDFSADGTAAAWNGHWTYAPRTWRMIAGNRPYIINRHPRSAHVQLTEGAGLNVVAQRLELDDGGVDRAALDATFTGLSDDDLRCRGACIVATR